MKKYLILVLVSKSIILLSNDVDINDLICSIPAQSERFPFNIFIPEDAESDASIVKLAKKLNQEGLSNLKNIGAKCLLDYYRGLYAYRYDQSLSQALANSIDIIQEYRLAVFQDPRFCAIKKYSKLFAYGL